MSGTSSADRILALLDVFTEDRLEWTPEQLMAKLGYSRPTLYRYLKTLREAGLLISMPNGCLTIGPRVVEMDYLMQRSDPLLHLGQPHLTALSENYPCSALLVRWYGTKLLCVASECSTPDPLSSYPRGRPMPIARGSISRAIMAFLPRRQLDPLIRDNLRELASIGMGATLPEIMESLRSVRRAGVAIAHGEVTPGVVGVAAPIFNEGSAPIAALCITIAAGEVNASRLTALSGVIRRAARDITDALAGYPETSAGKHQLRRSA